MADPFVAALKHLIGDTARRRMEVAAKIGANEQTLYQIANGIPLKSGKARSVGRELRAKLDEHYPSWLTASGHGAAAPLVAQEDRAAAHAVWPLPGIDAAKLGALPRADRKLLAARLLGYAEGMGFDISLPRGAMTARPSGVAIMSGATGSGHRPVSSPARSADKRSKNNNAA